MKNSNTVYDQIHHGMAKGYLYLLCLGVAGILIAGLIKIAPTSESARVATLSFNMDTIRTEQGYPLLAATPVVFDSTLVPYYIPYAVTTMPESMCIFVELGYYREAKRTYFFEKSDSLRFQKIVSTIRSYEQTPYHMASYKKTWGKGNIQSHFMYYRDAKFKF